MHRSYVVFVVASNWYRWMCSSLSFGENFNPFGKFQEFYAKQLPKFASNFVSSTTIGVKLVLFKFPINSLYTLCGTNKSQEYNKIYNYDVFEIEFNHKIQTSKSDDVTHPNWIIEYDSVYSRPHTLDISLIDIRQCRICILVKTLATILFCETKLCGVVPIWAPAQMSCSHSQLIRTYVYKYEWEKSKFMTHQFRCGHMETKQISFAIYGQLSIYQFSPKNWPTNGQALFIQNSIPKKISWTRFIRLFSLMWMFESNLLLFVRNVDEGDRKCLTESC